MQALTFQNDSEISQGAMINRAQAHKGPSHEDIRDAVRAWAGVDGQDVVTVLIIEEYRAQGGDDITFPDDLCRKRQKLFRFLDNQFNSERYRENVRQLTPAILAVLPLAYRDRVVKHDDAALRIARTVKEDAEAIQAVMLKAPKQVRLKEISEKIVASFYLDGPDSVAPLMAMVTTMLGGAL